MSVTAAKRTAAIVGVHNTRQGRRLDGESSRGLAIKAILGALDDAGLTLDAVDGISASPQSTSLIYDLRIGPAWQGLAFGVGMITEAVTAIEHGLAQHVDRQIPGGDHAEGIDGIDLRHDCQRIPT